MEYQLFVTPEAVKHFKKRSILSPNLYLRLGVKGSGCNGFSYVMELTDVPKRSQDLLFALDIPIVVDTKSIKYLHGSTIDWDNNLISFGFKIKNPQEISKCGCGNSFSTKENI